jgi:hypothetical protein
MPWPNDPSRSLNPSEQGSCLVAVIKLSEASWLLAGTVPGIERRPLKKISPDETALLRVLQRWRDEAIRSGRPITRIAVAFEAGHDGFWLARWLTGHGVEAHVIHPTSVAILREHKRAKTDRLDTAMLMRVFLGWLRGERGHCGMVAVPTIEEDDARRPSRERENLVGERTRIVNRMKAALARLGIRGFKPELRRAPRLLEQLRTPDGSPIPPNTLDEMRRDLARLASCASRSRRSNRHGWTVCSRRRRSGRMRWCGSWPASSASASRRRTCWSTKCSRVACATAERSPATPASPVRPTRAAPGDARKAWPNPAMPGSAAT